MHPGLACAAMADIEQIRTMVEQAIDDGATTVEEIHKKVAAAPLNALKGVGPLAGAAEQAGAVADQSIGAVYDAIRFVNEQVGALAEQLLKNVPGRSGDA